jgi:trigger factor
LEPTVEKLEGNRVRVTVSHSAVEVDEAVSASYARLSHRLKLPGFRPGRAPRPLIDGRVGRDSVLAEALEGLVESSYPIALDTLRLRPMGAPDTGDLDLVVEGAEYTYTAEVDVRPDLTVTSIEDLKAKVPPSSTTDAEIDAQIEYLRDRFATLEVVEDRGIADGDFALLSFKGTVDGQPAEDLTVDKYLYELGRGIMPQEFDAGIIGAKVGETVHVEFHVPEDAANREYVGKMAAFEIEIHEIKAKQLPAVDDELATNIGGLETMAELREDIRTKLDENKATAHTRLVERGARAALSERLVGDIPNELVASRTQAMTEEFFDSLKDQGMSIQEYLEATDVTTEQIQSDISREAALRVRDELALEALFRAAGLEYTEEELEAEIAKLAEADKFPVAGMRDRLVRSGLMGLLRERLMHRHATRYLMEHVEVVEVDPASARAEDKPKAKAKKKTTAKKPPSKAGDSSESKE